MSDRTVRARNTVTGEVGMVRVHTVDQHPHLYDTAPEAPAVDGGHNPEAIDTEE